MKKKLFTLLTLLLAVCSGAWASTVSDLVSITSATTFTMDGLNGTSGLVDATLYADSKLLCLGGCGYSAKKGSTEYNETTYKNVYQIKSSRQIAFKIGFNAKITIVGQSHSERKWRIGTTSAGNEIAESAVSTTTLSGVYDGSSTAQVVYINATGDLYIGAIIIEAAPVVTPTFSLSKTAINTLETSQIKLGAMSHMNGVAFNGDVTFSNAGVVTVNAAGVVTPVAAGTTTINFNTSAVDGKYNATTGNSLSITVTNPTCATPTFSPEDGSTFSGASQQITLSCATDGAAIHYTLDGSTPTGSSATYDPASKPTISSTTTIKAIAVKDGYDNSSVATVTITKVIPTAWKSWEFTDWSDATKTGILGDATNWDNKEKDGGLDWSSDNAGRSNITTLSNATIQYGSTTIPETDGLKFTTSAANQIALLFNLPSAEGMGSFHGSKFIWLYGSSSKIIIPNVPAGATVTIGIESHKTSESRQMNVSNASPANASVSGFEEKTFTVSANGDVTINPNGKGMHIYYIRVTENVETVPVSTKDSRNYASYVTSKKLDFAAADGITAYIATGLNGGNDAVVLSSVDVVPSGTPIIVKTDTKGATVNVPVTTSDASVVSGNKLVEGDGTAWNGTANTTYYYLASDMFHQATSGNLQTGKAYLAITSGGAHELNIVFDDASGTTGIAELQNSKTAAQGTYYNLNGQRVNANHKGIVIVNGKKFMNK